jgi:hypothetical protein
MDRDAQAFALGAKVVMQRLLDFIRDKGLPLPGGPDKVIKELGVIAHVAALPGLGLSSERVSELFSRHQAPGTAQPSKTEQSPFGTEEGLSQPRRGFCPFSLAL